MKQQPEDHAFSRYVRRPTRRRLAAVVRVFHEHVWGAALRITGSHEDAADICQEVFLFLFLFLSLSLSLSLSLHPPSPDSVQSPRVFLASRAIKIARNRRRSGERRGRREEEAARSRGDFPFPMAAAVWGDYASCDDRYR